MYLRSWPIKFSCTCSLLCEPSLAHHLRITEFGGLWQTLNTGGQGYLWNDAISRWTSDSLLIKVVIFLSLHHFTNVSTFTILVCYFVYDFKMLFVVEVGTSFLWSWYDIKIAINVDTKTHEADGRVIFVEFNSFYLMNTYAPNNGWKDEQSSFQRRRKWDQRILDFVSKRSAKPLIWCGDLNVR